MTNEFLIRADYLPKILPQKNLALLENNNFVAFGGEIETRIVDNIGIVPVGGILTNNDSSILSFLFSNGITYQYIRKSLAEFAQNKLVKAVILDINSPGGDAYGVAELAEYINSYSKPIIAYVSGQAASAAYWFAAAANVIVAHRTAFVGSIGTYAIIEKSENESFIVSEQSPKKVPDVSTDEGVAQIRRHMNTMTEHFISDVAKYRNKEIDFVKFNFGQGDVENAVSALSVGMIDVVGNFETALQIAKSYNSKSKKIKDKKFFGGISMTRNRIKNEFVIVDSDSVSDDVPVQEVTVELIKQLFPEIAEALIDEGRKLEAAENAEIDDAASLADMSDEDEKNAVQQARAKKISAAELTKKLLAIKTAKIKMSQNFSARAADEIPPVENLNASSRGALANKLRLMRKK